MESIVDGETAVDGETRHSGGCFLPDCGPNVAFGMEIDVTLMGTLLPAESRAPAQPSNSLIIAD